MSVPGQQQPGQLRRRAQAGIVDALGDERGGAADHVDGEADGRARRRVAQAVVIDDLDDVGLVDGADGLARLVVVNEDDLQAGRVERLALATDAHVAAVVVDDPELIALLAHDAVQRVAHAAVGLELGHRAVAGLAAGHVHQLADAHLFAPRVGADGAAEEVEQADDRHQAEGFALAIDDGGHATSAVGDRPHLAQRVFGRGRVQAVGDRLEARRSVAEQHRRLDAQVVEDPGRLRVQMPGAGGDGVVALVLQQPGITHGRGDGVGIGVDVPDDVDGVVLLAVHSCIPD